MFGPTINLLPPSATGLVENVELLESLSVFALTAGLLAEEADCSEPPPKPVPPEAVVEPVFVP